MTALPHKVNVTSAVLLMGKPVPVMVATMPPYVPALFGVTALTVKGIEMAEIDEVSA